jgi:hypothetical protein
MTDEDKGQTDQKSFMQKHKNVTCYKCGKKATMQTSVPMGLTMMRHQLDQVPATTAGLTALNGVGLA